MATTVATPATAAKTHTGVPAAPHQDTSCVLALLRDAMDQTGWTHEALAAHLRDHGFPHIDRPYITKMLATGRFSTTKPVSLRHLYALPADLRRTFVALCAERVGLIVAPQLDEASAQRAFAQGLFSLVAHGAAKMAKAAGR
jgi:hypothetical protein